MNKIALNGYGRIGRAFHRITEANNGLEVICINSRADVNSHVHLLKYDTVYGRFNGTAEVIDENNIKVNEKPVKVFIDKNPGEINWDDLGVEIVVEATGKFKDRDSCQKQLDTGAKKVVISAPGKDEDISIVMGVNQDLYDPNDHHIISNASCTTNALALIVKVLIDEFGIDFMNVTTVHAVTKSQNILDGSHRKNLRIARAAYESIIPSSTGASKAIAKIFPELSGKVIAKSIRVPVPTVSLLDISVCLEKSVDAEEVNEVIKRYSEGKLNGYLGYTEDPVVSSDFIGENLTAVADLLLTKDIGDRMVNLSVWYDNEWGYTARLYDLVKYVGNH